MVYLAELLDLMTAGLKIVRILARNIPLTRTQALIDDDSSLASLSCSRKANVYNMTVSWSLHGLQIHKKIWEFG